MTATTSPIRKRLRDWQSRFAAHIAGREILPFAWGSNDCALAFADGVFAITGTDPLADLRGYKTERQAARILKREGGMRGLAAKRLGDEVIPALAQPGDVGLAVLDGRETYAQCGGAVWVAPGPVGLERIAVASIVACWRCA